MMNGLQLPTRYELVAQLMLPMTPLLWTLGPSTSVLPRSLLTGGYISVMYMEIDPAQAWETLRASRSNRPGRATQGARAKTYSTALEQAQQMFRAAEAVGPQTRSLLIFYGLSQAGRAIAAAAVDLKGTTWNLVSHGIRATGFHKGFAAIEIRTDPRAPPVASCD